MRMVLVLSVRRDQRVHSTLNLKRLLYGSHCTQRRPFNPFTPKSDQFQISPAASPAILHHTVYKELGFSWRTQMEDDYTTNSHYITYTFLFRKVGRMYFLNLGVKGIRGPQVAMLLVQNVP